MTPKLLRCDGMRVENCAAPVARIDAKGFIYCDPCGLVRKQYQSCRKLTPKELKQLQAGKPLERY